MPHAIFPKHSTKTRRLGACIQSIKQIEQLYPISNFRGNFCYSNLDMLRKTVHCHRVTEFRLQITIQAIIQISHRASVSDFNFSNDTLCLKQNDKVANRATFIKTRHLKYLASMFIDSVNYQNARDWIELRDSSNHILWAQFNKHLDFANNITIKQ